MIRYGARFYGHDTHSLQLAAGTVFNQVIIWKPTEEDKSMDDKNRIVHHRLCGHEVGLNHHDCIRVH
jgi:hypothetical protein